ncbi:TIGR03086 family metal-binding protein [Streptomyces hyaluromycini]|uniref:TIGR03086 family metal-binding protein n=1 Tax=Streptomyces hyaluromycini TaxID=1377993 RepID=UPI000B5CDA9F|nr:TIGR03086 family metal-binding protein [Streptomyces hyaluromycini]
MTPLAGAEQLTQSIGLVAAAVDGAPVDQYENPTPDAEWRVKDLVNHIAMMLVLTRDAGARTASDPALLTANPVPVLAGRPESEWALVVNGLAGPAAGAWSGTRAWQGKAALGGPPMPAEALGGILIAEFAVHAWDVAVATGQRLDVPESLARAMLGTYAREAPRMRGLGLLADEVPQDVHASLFERSLALSGRDPRWSPPCARGGKGCN